MTTERDPREEVAELRALFDLQWKRSRQADKLWQAAHPGMDLVWPDLGELLTWLMQGHSLVREWRDGALAGDAVTMWDLTERSTAWLGPSDTRQTDGGPETGAE